MFKRMFQQGVKGRDRAALLESTGQAGEVSDRACAPTAQAGGSQEVQPIWS